jgi:hypothetical protein
MALLYVLITGCRGILIHSLTEGAGMPLSTCTTPAKEDERAQLIPPLDALPIRTGRSRGPWKRLRVIEADKIPQIYWCLIGNKR